MIHNRRSQRNRRSWIRRPSKGQSSRLSTLLCLCIFFYICTVSKTLSLRGLEEQQPQQEVEERSTVKCFAYSECTICPKSGNREGCDPTNRRQTYHCHVASKEGTSSSSSQTTTTYSEFRSCQRTVSDESRLLLRFQIVCLFTGIFSVMSMKKQKMTTASLFEQRRRKPQQSSTIDNVKYSSLPNNNNHHGMKDSETFTDSDTISAVTSDV